MPSATARAAHRLAILGTAKQASEKAAGPLGLVAAPIPIEGGDGSGAMVMSVDPKGQGAAAGVYQGDIIVTWNSEPIQHVHSLLRALGPDSVGQTITLGLRRAGETKQVPLTIAERHAA
jgi:S1-C subfamily serine protease